IEAAARDTAELPQHIAFDGFFAFSRAELRLLHSLAARCAVTVTLPNWSGDEGAREFLLSLGFAEQKCEQTRRSARTVTFSAPTLERETEEIARRILEHAARGRLFREMSIVLRSRDPYGPALETTLARFGIPARFYFADPVNVHPAVAFLAGIVRTV